MSESETEATDIAIQIMDLDGVSVSREDDDGTDEVRLGITCQNHDGDSTIETEDVCEVLKEHGKHPKNVIADFDAGAVRIEVEI